MTYEVGQKVETPLGVGVVVGYNDTYDMYLVDLNDEFTNQQFKEYHLKPYKTPHEKLIELGWKHFDEDKMGVIYENESAYLNIYKTHKYYIFETKESGKYIENKVEIDLELSRILTDYLEWLEEVKE